MIVGAILAWRQVIDWRVPVVYLLTIAVLAAAAALIGGAASYEGVPGFLWYPLVHVFSGGVIFGAVFMLTDPVTSPTSAQGRVLFAMGAGILTMLIRLKANLPEGCPVFDLAHEHDDAADRIGSGWQAAGGAGTCP